MQGLRITCGALDKLLIPPRGSQEPGLKGSVGHQVLQSDSGLATVLDKPGPSSLPLPSHSQPLPPTRTGYLHGANLFGGMRE